jgi:ribosomal protein S9
VVIIVFVLAVIVAAILLVVAGIRRSRNVMEDPLAARLAEYSQHEAALRDAGFLTRDSRVVERKK